MGTQVKEILNMTWDDIEDTFGVEINDDGSLYDGTEDVEFSSIAEWAQWMVEQESTITRTKIRVNRDWDE